MSFYSKSNPWNPGYAVPKYVLSEPPGRGTYTTKWLPRGTISEFVPDYLAKPAPKKGGHTLSGSSLAGSSLAGSSLAGSSLSGTSLSGNVLDTDTLGASTKGKENPIQAYGNQSAAWIMANIVTVPEGQRNAALKELLDKIDPELYKVATNETERLKAQGIPTKAAVKKGLALAFSTGVTKEFVKLGMSKKAPKKGKGALGLGLTGGQYGLGNYGSLGGLLDFVKDGLNTIGKYACKVATNSVTPIAAGAGAAYLGAPPEAGVAGAGIAASLCSKGGGTKGGGTSGQQPPYTPPKSTTPPWLLPAAIGGGALLLIVALK